MSDLKQDLDHILGWIVAPENQNDVVKIRARLERATVTEPPERDHAEWTLPIQPELCERLRSLGKTIGAPGYWAGWADRLERATVTENAPTDASLLADLRRELGEGWTVWEADNEPSCCDARCGTLGTIGFPEYVALRRPNGVRDCAAALKLLAGVDA